MNSVAPRRSLRAFRYCRISDDEIPRCKSLKPPCLVSYSRGYVCLHLQPKAAECPKRFEKQVVERVASLITAIMDSYFGSQVRGRVA